ncbi:RICIN domain-containing protein [Phormidium sp. LEGE 05292]|uniref:RICIN domain-containing protein n=1 Tax=[Phormidium] sp. LEGE 05292 TaxID=767427 RepID=UPI00187FC517|nr:RICIN domain-containing protein [Phormidium sp. LEGE 05292]MBE9227559.1 RICIN domain-containing protein [Phormidium sp. LEGE 05292]
MASTPLATQTSTNDTQLTSVYTVAKFASGRTQPGATNWQKENDYVFVDVDTSAAGFAQTPIYVTSIAGDSNHYGTTGASSVYKATATGFRVYIRWEKDYKTEALTAEIANSYKWHINWIGFEPFSQAGQGTSTQTSPTTTQPTPLPAAGKYYYIVAKHSGKTIAVKNASQDNEANIIQYQATGDNHKFQFQDAGDGYFYIVAKHSGKTIAVKGASKDNEANIIQYQEKGDNHKFKLENAGDGYFYIVAKHSGKTIAVKDASKDNEANIIQYQETGDNHKWKLEAV